MPQLPRTTATPYSKSDQILSNVQKDNSLLRTFSEATATESICRTTCEGRYSFDGLAKVEQQGNSLVINSPGKPPITREIDPKVLESECKMPINPPIIAADKIKLIITRTDTKENKKPPNENFKSLDEFKYYFFDEKITKHNFSLSLKISVEISGLWQDEYSESQI